MDEVFAGFICGYVLALLVTPVIAIALIRARVNSDLMHRIAPEGTSLIAVSIIIHTFAFLTLIAIGIVFGMMLSGLKERRPDGGLASPNGAFTLIVVAIAAIAVLPLGYVVPRWRPPLLIGALVFIATFGWIMPYLSLVTHAKG